MFPSHHGRNALARRGPMQNLVKLRPSVLATGDGGVKWTLVEERWASPFAMSRLLDILLEAFGQRRLAGEVVVHRMDAHIRPRIGLGLHNVPAPDRHAVKRHLSLLPQGSFLYYMHDAAASCLLLVDMLPLAVHDVALGGDDDGRS